MKEAPDYYRILGVSPTASREEIRRAYRKLAMASHPDRHRGVKQKARVEERLKAINEAHRILSDPTRRREYDESRWHRRWRQAGGNGSPKGRYRTVEGPQITAHLRIDPVLENLFKGEFFETVGRFGLLGILAALWRSAHEEPQPRATRKSGKGRR